MQKKSSLATIEVSKEPCQLLLSGNWNLNGIKEFAQKYHNFAWPQQQQLPLNGKEIKKMDSAGAWQLHLYTQKLTELGNKVTYVDFKPIHLKLLKLVTNTINSEQQVIEKPVAPSFVYRIGEGAVNKFKQINGFLTMVGELSLNFINAIFQWRRFHITSIINVIEHTGYRALPILALLSFLIGIVLAYQMGLQLETYGANIFIVYLTGMAVFREFAPLITAIIVAGRTSSSFTAQIGTMKVNEEIDALLTMGLSPIERLVLPKVLGLLITLPLLILWSDLFGILGSMVMAKFQLKIGYAVYLQQLKETVPISNYWIGMSKAPSFALIVAAVGCYQGFLVSSSAASVGIQTTKSVVQALFLIIIADAIFSVFYSWLGL